MLKAVFLLLVFALTTVRAMSHEFWIEPDSMQIPLDGRLKANVTVGEMLDGTLFPFEPRAYERAIWAGPSETVDLSRVPLSNSELDLAPMGEGLHILAVSSFRQRHTYASSTEFQDFVQEMGLTERLGDLDLTTSFDGPIRETYRRLSKTLVNFGAAKGSDRRIGLPKEWVASDGAFTLYSGQQTIADHPAFLFCREDGADRTVTKSKLITDKNGEIRPTLPKNARCLLNSVFLEAVSPDQWQSDWVSIFVGTSALLPSES